MKSFRIARPDTAFSTEPTRRQRKRPREKAEAHLAWIRTLPCVITGTYASIEAAHIRYGDPIFGKRPTGLGEKPSDQWVVPLSAEKHRLGKDAQHNGAEREFWDGHNVDPLQVAAALWACSGDDEQAELILRSTRKSKRSA